VVESVAESVGFDIEVELCLEVEPEPRCGPEVTGQTKSGVGGDRSLSVNDLVDAAWRDADVFGEPVLRQACRLEELFKEYLAWVDGGELGRHRHLLVVVHNLDVVGVACLPPNES